MSVARRLLLPARLRSARAFSLIELLVVILVLGVLIAVAAPSFLGQVEKAQISAARQQLTIAYKAAKAASVENDPQGNYIESGPGADFDHADLADAIKDSEPQFTTGVADQGQDQDPLKIYVDAVGSNATTTTRLVLHNQSEADGDRYCSLDTVGLGQPLNVYCNDTGVPAPSLDGSSTPTVTGTTQEGQTLSVNEGSWFDGNPGDFDYQWQTGPSWADIAAVDGGTNENYIVRTADVGDTLRVCVTANGIGGSTTACSPAAPSSGTVLPNPPVPSGTGPTITGLAQEGETLTVSNGTWTSSQTLTYARQWLSCTSATDLNTCTNVGAGLTTYVVQVSDIDRRIRARITATDPYNQSMVNYADATPAAVSAVPVGLVLAYSGQSTPAGWLEADGAAVNRSTYAALFSEVGTTYGAGNGSTTFNTPNLSGRTPIGAGSGITRGQTGGALDQSGTVNPWGTLSLSFSWTETPSTPASISHSHTSNNPRSTGYWANNWYTWVNPSVSLLSNNETFSVSAVNRTAAGSLTPSASYSVSNAPFRAVRYLIAASATSTAPCGALWGYGGASAPAGSQMADGAPATGSLAACMDSAFAGNTPDLRGRFALGKATSGTGSTLAGAGGSIDQTVSATLNTASTAGNVSSPSASSTLTEGSHSHTRSHTTFSQMSNGGDVPLAVDSSPGVGANSNAGATYSATYANASLAASGSGAQAPTSAAFNSPFLATNWVAYTSSSYTPAIGTITPFAGATAPSRWLLANGGCYSTSTYANLFAVFAYTYGGSGASFCVPDLRSKAPLGKSTSGTGSTLGAVGGTLTPSPTLSFTGWTPSITVPVHSYDWTVPAHTHTVGAWSSVPGNSGGGGGALNGRYPDAHTSTAAGGGTPSGSVAETPRTGTVVGGAISSPSVGPAPYLGLNMMVYAGQ